MSNPLAISAVPLASLLIDIVDDQEGFFMTMPQFKDSIHYDFRDSGVFLKMLNHDDSFFQHYIFFLHQYTRHKKCRNLERIKKDILLKAAARCMASATANPAIVENANQPHVAGFVKPSCSSVLAKILGQFFNLNLRFNA